LAKKKKNKKLTLNQLDKMSFEKREKYREKMRKEAVTTKSFRTPQSFGAASKCVSLSIEEYLSYSPNPETVRIIKNENN
jgi:hypothetical protein